MLSKGPHLPGESDAAREAWAKMPKMPDSESEFQEGNRRSDAVMERYLAARDLWFKTVETAAARQNEKL